MSKRIQWTYLLPSGIGTVVAIATREDSGIEWKESQPLSHRGCFWSILALIWECLVWSFGKLTSRSDAWAWACKDKWRKMMALRLHQPPMGLYSLRSQRFLLWLLRKFSSPTSLSSSSTSGCCFSASHSYCQNAGHHGTGRVYLIWLAAWLKSFNLVKKSGFHLNLVILLTWLLSSCPQTHLWQVCTIGISVRRSCQWRGNQRLTASESWDEFYI